MTIKSHFITIIMLAAMLLALATVTTAKSETLPCTCGDICVNTSGCWRDGGVFNESETPIQAAVDDATAGEMIYVYNGSYSENVNVNKRLTLQGEGVDFVTVTAPQLDGNHVFNVTADYVIISGFKVTGATSSRKAGIYLSSGVDHCNILNNTATGNSYGIYLYSSSNNTLTNNTANSNYGNNGSYDYKINSSDGYGIYLYSSSYNTLTNNNVSSNYGGNGIAEESGFIDAASIVNAGIGGDGYGIYLSSSSYNTLANNNVSSNHGGCGYSNGDGYSDGYGIFLSSSSYNTLVNNNVYSNYGGDCGDGYGIYFSSSSYNTLINNNVSSNYGGNGMEEESRFIDEESIENVGIGGDGYGIYLSSSSYNTFANNNISSNCGGYGSYSESASADYFCFNGNSGDGCGIYLSDLSNYNTLTNNNVSSNYGGSDRDGGNGGDSYGIYIYSSSYNTFMNNNISSNNGGDGGLGDADEGGDGYGIYIYFSSNNTLANNNVCSNNAGYGGYYSFGGGYGIYLSSSSNNAIHNNYFNNTYNAYDNGNNIWNITSTTGTNIIGGSWLGGNYWSDYTGNDTNGDGLGDTLGPYNSLGKISNGGDYLPLVMSD